MIDLDTNAAEEAYTQAKAGFELFGQELKPYSPSRKVAAQRMGMVYPCVGEEGVEQLERGGMYPGLLSDVAIFTWLCTLPDGVEMKLLAGNAEPVPVAPEWTPSTAFRKPQQAFEKAMEWADSKGMLDATQKPFHDACRIFMAVMQGVSASQFRLQVEGATPNGEAVPKT